MKDAKAKFAVLRKRMREAEDAKRARKLLGESLEARKELESKVNNLKLSLVMAGVNSPKSK